MGTTDGRKHHAQMRLYFGAKDDAKCGECGWLIRYQMSLTWFKCHRGRVTGGRGTDWRKKWLACGAFTKKGASK